MTAQTGLTTAPGTAADTAAPGSEQSQLHQSLVRFTRFYATLSPTMMALLLAKKTRYGRFIPLPDALPDGTKVGRWVFSSANGTNGTNGTHSAGTAAGSHNGTHIAGQVPGSQNGTVSALDALPTTAGAYRNGTNGHVPGPELLALPPGQAQPAASGGAEPAAVRPVPTKTVRAVEYEVVHNVPGRVRIKIPRLAHDTKFAQRLADGIMALPGVHEARVNPSSRSLVVGYRHQLPGARAPAAMLAHIVECIREAALVDAVKNLAPASDLDVPRADPVDVVGRMALPALSLGLGLGMLAGLSLPAWLAGGVVLVAARPIFGRAIQGMRTEKRLTVEVLDATTITLMVLQASILPPAIITSVIEGSEVLREMTARRSRQASLELMMSLENPTTVERAGHQAPRTWDEIEPHDVLQLQPGDEIPADGFVLDGQALVDQQKLTGDTRPVPRTAGDTVQAASRVIDGHLRVVAQQTAHDTRLGQTLAALRAEPKQDTRVSNYARQVGNWAVVPTLLLGGAVFAGSGSLARTTGIVNLDLGTGMRVSSPIGILHAQTQAARRGILIRSGRALEKLAIVDALLFVDSRQLLSGAYPGDSRRPAGAWVIEQLQATGIAVHVASDDGEAMANRLAAHLGLPRQQVHAGPSAPVVQALQAGGRTVAMMGQGIDDVAGMTQADVAISLGHASDLARETADVVLVHDDLRDLLVAIALARHAINLLEQNKILVVVPNLAGIAYGALTVMNPLTAMLLNNATAVVATLNSLRPLRHT